MIRVLDRGKQRAEENMRFDEKLLEELKPDDVPILHFYEFFEGAATYGYFMKPELYLKEGHGLELARRPTGGGMLFHLWDLTFSVLIPAGHFGYTADVMQNYKFINDIVIVAISDYLGVPMVNLLPEEPPPLDEACKHFCFAKPTKFDIMMEGKKVAGAAQRRKKNGFLHQGSISVVMPDFGHLERVLRGEVRVVEAMKLHTASLGEGSVSDLRKRLKGALQKSFTTL